MRVSLMAALGALVLTLGATAHAQSDVGLRVWVQGWNPTTDGDEPTEMLNDATLVSRSIHDGFARAEPQVEGAVVNLLQTSDMFADGVTLYDVTVDIPQPSFAVTSTAGGGETPASFTAAVGFEQIYVDATATQPSVFGSWADPHCNMRLGLAFDLPLRLGSDPSHPFESAIGPNTHVARITSVDIDSAGVVCDVVLAVLDLTGIKDALTRVLTDPNGQVATQLQDAIRPQIDLALDALNAAAATFVPPGGSMRSWASSSRITLAFAPAPIPDDGARASVSGKLTSLTHDEGFQSTVHCNELVFQVWRKTGPRPMIWPDGTLGGDPLELLTTPLSCEGDGQERYTLGGLAAHSPNYVDISTTTVGGHCPKHGVGGTYWSASISGLTDELGRVLPTALGVEHDLVAEERQGICDGYPVPEPPLGKPTNPGDPPFDLGNPVIDPVVIDPVVVTKQITQGYSAHAEQVMLNPQPLPPRTLKPQPLPPQELEQ